MPVDLREMLDPAHTAAVTMELQNGVVGDASPMRDLADAVAQRNVLANAAKVVRAARQSGARVVHCTAEFRPDLAGSAFNSPLLAAISKAGPHLLVGSREAAVVPELGSEPSDVICARRHGLTPFPGTDLDQTLRNLGVRTVVAMGVSVNLGVLGLVIGAVDLGYRVALVTDAVAGIPHEYADQVILHTLATLATRVTSDEVVAVWAP